jgi:hypothetical protein
VRGFAPCRHVFNSEAMAACEAKGHAFAWVDTMGGYGFDECFRCGETTRVRPKGEPAAWNGVEPVPAAPPPPPEPMAEKVHRALAPRQQTSKPHIYHRHNSAAAAERRDRVLELRATGLTQASIALQVGCSGQRVSQILKAAQEESGT